MEMDTISVNGEEYIKASVIARKLGYTSDYVGQLCRSGQVEARMVGRTWYVKESSISAHKKNRYRSVQAKTTQELQRTVADVRASRVPNAGSIATLNHYEDDSSSLIPMLRGLNSKENSESVEETQVDSEYHYGKETIEQPPSDDGVEVAVPIKVLRSPKKTIYKAASRVGEINKHQDRILSDVVERKSVPQASHSSVVPMIRPKQSLLPLVLASIVAVFLAYSFLSIEIQINSDASQFSTVYKADFFGSWSLAKEEIFSLWPL